MPYSTPLHSPAPLPTHSHGRPGHRRSFSTHDRFSDAHLGPGAFAPLGGLPRRTRSGSGTNAIASPALPQQKPRVFHIKSSDSDSDVESDNEGGPPPLQLKPKGNTFRLSLDTQNVPFNAPRTQSPIPFPRSSPLNSPQPGRMSPAPQMSPRPGMVRANSNPQIILSNGKVLKSSLKSSSSSPSIASQNLPTPVPPKHTAHMRARSAPATPSFDVLGLSDSSAPTTPKTVHFAGTDAVRIFNRTARPAALSFSGTGGENDTETETETEAPGYFGYMGAINMMKSGARQKPYAFPTAIASSTKPPEAEGETHYELDTSVTSTIPSLPLPAYALPSYVSGDPAPAHPSLARNVYLESLELISPPPSNPSEELRMMGTVVVRNIAFEKSVAVRFTLDDWNTTSEVVAKHTESLMTLPPALQTRHWGAQAHSMKSPTTDPPAAPQWDRFSFSIRLSDYSHNLDTRVLWFVVRFRIPGGGDWWDNNGGRDFRVAFRRVTSKESSRNFASARDKKTSAPAALPNLALPLSYQASGALPQVIQPPPAPPPAPPSTTSPTASVLAQKLSKLNLTNYSKPNVSGLPIDGSSESMPIGSKDNSAPSTKDNTPMASKLNTPVAGVGVIASPSPKIASRGMDLHWPWGSSQASAKKEEQTKQDEQPAKDEPLQGPRLALLPLAASAHSISPSTSTASEEDEDDVFDKKAADETPPTSPVLEKGKLVDEKLVVETPKAAPVSPGAELVVPMPKLQPAPPLVPLLQVEGVSKEQSSGRPRADTLDDAPKQPADEIPVKVAAPAEAIEIKVPTKQADDEARVVRDAVDALRNGLPNQAALLMPGLPTASLDALSSGSPSPSEFVTAPPSPSQRPQSPTSEAPYMAFQSLMASTTLARKDSPPSRKDSPLSSSPSSRSSSPVGPSTPPGQQKSAPLAHDSLYNAFVRQWCFAGAPTPTVSEPKGEGVGVSSRVVTE